MIGPIAVVTLIAAKLNIQAGVYPCLGQVVTRKIASNALGVVASIPITPIVIVEVSNLLLFTTIGIELKLRSCRPYE